MLPLSSLGLAAVVIAAAVAQPAPAQTASYPTRPVRFIVPSTPGGPTDVQARLVAEQLTVALGKQVIVDNRAGAGGRIGLEAAAKAQPDGHTIFFGSQGNLTVNPHIHRNLPYDPQKDFAPIVLLTRARYLLLANASVPASTVKELLALLKTRSGQFNYASIGTGSTSHIAGELFKQTLKVDLAHVPYKGAAAAMTDLIAGQVHFMFATPVASGPYLNSGRLKAIAIAAPRRSALFPAVPTFDESGLPGFEVSTWYGILTRAGVARPVIETLNGAINRILRSEDIRARLATLDAEAVGGTVDEFDAFIKSERVKWGAIVRAAGIKAE